MMTSDNEPSPPTTATMSSLLHDQGRSHRHKMTAVCRVATCGGHAGSLQTFNHLFSNAPSPFLPCDRVDQQVNPGASIPKFSRMNEDRGKHGLVSTFFRLLEGSERNPIGSFNPSDGVLPMPPCAGLHA